MLKARKLISVSLDLIRSKDPPISLGQSSILASLKANDVDFTAFSENVLSPLFSISKLHDEIMHHAGDNVDLALGAYVWHDKETHELLNLLKKSKFPGNIVLGGPQISYTKANLESFYPQADAFIRGYGEDALVSLMTIKPGEVVRGVHFNGQQDVGQQASVVFNDLPSPFLTGLIKPQRFIRWETQRGCPFRCSFCQHREPDNVAQKRAHFSESRVAQEIKWICENPVIQDIAVLDPTFNSGGRYLDVLHQFILHGYTGKLSLQCRAEMITEPFLHAVAQLNLTGHVVLEIGLQTIHKNEARMIDRPVNLNKVCKVFERIHYYNINTEISLIFGLPMQTVQSFQESVAFCKDVLGVPVIQAFPLMLLRGTPLYDHKHTLQLVESEDEEHLLDNTDALHATSTPGASSHDVNGSAGDALVGDSLPATVASGGSGRLTRSIPHVISSPTFSKDDWFRMAAIAKALDTYNATSAAAAAAAAVLKKKGDDGSGVAVVVATTDVSGDETVSPAAAPASAAVGGKMHDTLQYTEWKHRRTHHHTVSTDSGSIKSTTTV